MTFRLERLSRLLGPLQSVALAAIAGTAATLGMAEPASAQAPRTERGSVWDATARHGRVVDRRAPDYRVPRNECGPNLGRYETRYEQVWVPGRVERRWVAPRYEWRYDRCGRRYRVQVCAGYWDTIQHRGYYEKRAVRVWVPARRWDGVRRHRVSQVGRRFR